MPIWSRKWPFLEYSVKAAPLDQGVFGLWRDNELLFIGSTNRPHSLRMCLLEHFNGQHGEESRTADHYSWEVAENPDKRKTEVLSDYQRANGRLPKLNKPD